ncbi:MAG: diadenylate cyclase CdaA [Candidatus Latescibacterota bacterium]|nr:diadenylate cyclase CdaA [Candidatus Latescibacterota bacterium]MEC8645760.1 diadenylate cyclase CdaA [Candidatus Latescibacterota bacterium]MEE2727661.1 diadenylate cyclase CdaA [Candidatus Latescibacterota bacterium]
MFEDGLTLFYLFGFLPVSVFSLIDIALVSLVLYRLFGLIKGTRAGQMLVGLLLLVTLAMAAPWLQMNALAWLLEQVRSILLILLVILFQPELRRLLLALGQSQFLRWFYKVEPSRVIDEVVNGVVQVAEQGYGALIVLGRQSPLGSVVETGVAIDSEVSDDLLTTIFNPRTPLHDQAVVIQGERLIAARCTLPLAEEVEDQRLGTRHRAALGLAQESDAVTIVVSEETRTISLAIGGVLLRGLNRAELKQRLVELLAPQQTDMVAATRSPEEDEV